MNKLSVDYINKNYKIINANLDKIKITNNDRTDFFICLNNIEISFNNIMQVIKGHRNYLKENLRP